MTEETQSYPSYQNQFLVSMPQLDDPNFKQTVILMCKHDENGAVGVVINRKTEHVIGDILKQLEIEISSPAYTDYPVLDGGPVYPELGLIIHRGDNDSFESSMEIGGGLQLTSSRDILNGMAQGSGPDSVIMTLGYAGWAPGQLEEEMRANAWFTTPVDDEILFTPELEDKWQRSAKLIGIDTSQFSSQVGHA